MFFDKLGFFIAALVANFIFSKILAIIDREELQGGVQVATYAVIMYGFFSYLVNTFQNLAFF